MLETHAAVREAAVDELTALCRARLTRYEVPKHILLLDRLPRTPSTKVSRVELLELVRTALPPLMLDKLPRRQRRWRTLYGGV